MPLSGDRVQTDPCYSSIQRAAKWSSSSYGISPLSSTLFLRESKPREGANLAEVVQEAFSPDTGHRHETMLCWNGGAEGCCHHNSRTEGHDVSDPARRTSYRQMHHPHCFRDTCAIMFKAAWFTQPEHALKQGNDHYRNG